MNTFTHWTHDPAIARLGWVLVHFLWEGAAIGIALALALAVLRRASAQCRYVVTCLALVACTAAPVVTWFVMGQEGVTQPAVAQIHPILSLHAATGFEPDVVAPPTGAQIAPLLAASASASPAQVRIGLVIETMLPYLVLAWGVAVLVLSLRLIFCWFELRGVCEAGLRVTSGLWRSRLEALCAQMGVTRAIRFIESGRVDVPTVFGWLKPVLILPATFLTSLPSDQIEAILAHELAHIRRHDYLVNIFQLVIETVLFYHPAIWWISRAIRQERENCCDDLAVRIVGDRLAYASALATLEESRAVSLAITLAATGGTLLGRIRRILGQREVRASRQAWFAPLALAAVMAVIIGAGVYSYAGKAQEESDDPFGNVDLNQGSPDEVNNYRSAFRNAVIADKVGLVEAFFRHGFKAEPTDIKSGMGDILSDAAYFTKDPKMVRMLLAHGAKPAGGAHDRGATANSVLTWGNKEIVDILIVAGAACDPIWYDAALGQLDDLKKRDAQHPLDPKQIGNALDYAVSAGQVKTFDWLWTKAQAPDAAANAKKLSGFYERAALNGNLALLLHLEQMGVKPADGGVKALQNAVRGNQVAVAKYLFDKGVVLPNDPKQSSPLVDAAAEYGDRLEMIRLLLDHGADINARHGNSWTVLCWAAYMGREDVCQLLIKRGADLDIADKSDHTAVWYAACGSHCPGALELMLKKGAHFKWTDSDGLDLFSYSLRFGAPQLGVLGFPGEILTPAEQRDYDAREERTVDLLVSAGLDPSGKEGTDTPLKAAFQNEHYPAAHALLRHHPDINVKDGEGNPAITYLLGWCHSVFPLDVLETLLQQGADPNASYPMPGVTPPLKRSVLQTALEYLNYPRVEDQRAAVQTLIQHRAKFPGVKSQAGQALLLAAAKGDQNGMKEALTHGASPDASDSGGNSPMGISMTLRYFDNAVWLVQQGAKPKQDGNQLLAAAVEANRLDMVNLLLSKGIDPRESNSGLGFAVRNGNREIFDTLLKAGANPKDADIFTCIQNARPEMARILLDRGVDPQPPPFAENRANVYWAVCYNQPEIVKMLLDHGADPTMMSAYGETPLSVAEQFHKEMVPVIDQAIRRWHADSRTIQETVPPGMDDLAQKAADSLKQGQYDQASAAYEQMTKAHPDSLYAWSNLGASRFQRMDYAGARDALLHAIQLKPDDAFAVTNLGITYCLLEAYDKAVATLKTAVQLIPNDPNAHYFLGMAYASLKQKQQSDAEFQKARDIESKG